MNCTIEQYNSRAEWLAARRSGIGSSDAAAILGESSWASPYSVWAEKRGLEPTFEESERMRWGTILEAPIRDEYARRTKRNVRHYGSFAIVRNNKYPWLISSLDGDIEEPEGNGIYEGKTVDAFLAKEWGEKPPLKYQIQIQQQMLNTGYGWGSMNCLIGGNEMKWFDLLAEKDFQAVMLDELAKFWDCVQSGREPEIDGSAATTRAIKTLHPNDDGSDVVLPDEAADRWARRESLADEIKSLEEEKTAIDNWMKAKIGPHTFGTCKGDCWTYKTQSRAEHQVKASTFRVLRKKGR